jgi:hypothetical protein
MGQKSNPELKGRSVGSQTQISTESILNSAQDPRDKILVQQGTKCRDDGERSGIQEIFSTSTDEKDLHARLEIQPSGRGEEWDLMNEVRDPFRKSERIHGREDDGEVIHGRHDEEVVKTVLSEERQTEVKDREKTVMMMVMMMSYHL